MEKKDVPRDGGSEFGILLQSFYVLDENGNYECVKCDGWETINIAYYTAKEFDNEDLAGVLERVKKGELSPLAYHMNKYLMDAKVLAQYVTLGQYDFINVLEAPNNETIAKVATELGSRGTLQTNTLAALTLDDFIKSLVK